MKKGKTVIMLDRHAVDKLIDYMENVIKTSLNSTKKTDMYLKENIELMKKYIEMEAFSLSHIQFMSLDDNNKEVKIVDAIKVGEKVFKTPLEFAKFLQDEFERKFINKNKVKNMDKEK